MSRTNNRDYETILHDLRVHQAELEAQNHELREARHDLEHAVVRYGSLFELAPVGYVVHDESGRIEEANAAAAELLGTDRLAMRGSFLDRYCVSEDLPVLFSFLRRCRQTGDRQEGELRLKCNGHIVTVHLAGIRMSDDHGKDSFLTALIDMTERKKAEEAMAAAKYAAEEASRTKAQFLANMSHEIRNPMAGVLGMLELVQGEDLPEKVHKYLATARDSAHVLLRLLNDILDTSRIEAGKLDIVNRPFYLDVCIHSVMEGFSTQANGKNLRMAFSFDPDLPRLVIGDELRLRQIFMNLVGNALKFTHVGEIELTVRPDSDSAGVLFTVRDTGIGIPQDKLEHIFEPFTQADISDTRKYGGTGLGLTLCRQLVTLMGGNIRVESMVGVGTSFSFVLPLPAAEDREITRPQAKPAAEFPDGKIVLIADDDSTVANMFQVLLDRKGVRSIVASNGKEAIDLWEKEHVDLILMDIQMPVMDGREAVAEIRKKETERGGHVPIVAVTARAMQDEERAIRKTGFDDYVSKPLNFSIFYDILAKNLKGAQ